MPHLALSEPLAFRCPHCQAAVGLATPTGLSSVAEKTWLQDGDTIPGLTDLFDKEEGRSFAAALMMGRCDACSQAHYVVDAVFVDGEEDDLIDWWAGAFEIKDTRCLGGQLEFLPDAAWAVTRITTECGKHVDEHLFGPFTLDASHVNGPNGVSACCGRGANTTWEGAAQRTRMAWMDMISANTREPEPLAA